MEDYKKKYETAINQAKEELKVCGSLNCDAARQIFRFFPELKESEDDIMRKMAIHAVYSPEAQSCIKSWGINPSDVIAWLERQSEQKSTDKVEPKFNVGDWIINSEGMLRHIVDVDKTGYQTDNGWLTHDDYENGFHLWTIQDAKDGDVLVAKIDKEPNDFIYIFDEYDKNGFWSHCYLDAYINKFHEGIYHNNFNVGVPATKEQCDLLFQKMKEAGYEWDSEKKELRKIEQNPTWSEEDEQMLNHTISTIELHLNDIGSDRKEILLVKEEIEWLKSLKERVKLQPIEINRRPLKKNEIKVGDIITYFKDGKKGIMLVSSFDAEIYPRCKWGITHINGTAYGDWAPGSRPYYHATEEEKQQLYNTMPEYVKDWLKSLKEKMKGEL